ncbi:hypothetical protein CUB97_10645 [Prevotella intermedia]|uniref:Uncharacterized protein n=1 Tax=Prevotella intermedia TaxID=28131 RepID=A0A2M8M3Q0_PREIN|nr:hypothetical protein CUB97_10645 [Prevotella intermedia]
MHGKSGSFASQNLRFWKAKEKLSIFCKDISATIMYNCRQEISLFTDKITSICYIFMYELSHIINTFMNEL